MKFSARNAFKGKIKSMLKGPVNTEVVVILPGGDEIVATITTSSAERMGFSEGMETTALIKATQVILVSE